MAVRQLMHPTIAVRHSAKPVDVRGIIETLVISVIVGMLMFLAGNCAHGLMARPAAPRMMTITVQPGDTLWGLAKRYGDQDTYILARVESLARANKLSRGGKLIAGQTLFVPAATQSLGGTKCRAVASR